MKSWTESQIFFVFDVDYCQTEEDDPKDAIVYFYPKNVTSDFLCDLCLQLMGVARFTNACFSGANLIKLHRGKFALRTVGGYILVLKGSADMPDNVLQRQLQNIAGIFTFYHGSFESVLESVDNVRERFLLEIEPVLQMCLFASQCDGDTLSLTFNTIPNNGISKQTSGTLFLRAFHILQSCQKQPGVFAGCLAWKSKVLHSQLPSSLLKKMVGIKLRNSMLPGVPIETDFLLPTGVQLRQVQVTDEEFMKMSTTRARLVAAVPRSGRHQSRVAKEPEDIFPLEKIEESSVGDSHHAFRNPHFRVIVDESVTPEPVFSKRGNLYLGNINRDFLHSNYGHSECVSSDSGVMPSPTNLTSDEFQFRQDVVNLLEDEDRQCNPRKVFKRRHSDTDVADANRVTCAKDALRDRGELWAKWRSTNSLSDSESDTGSLFAGSGKRDSCSYVSSCNSIASPHEDVALCGKMARIKSVGSSGNVSELMQQSDGHHESHSDDGSCGNCSTATSGSRTFSGEFPNPNLGLLQDETRTLCLYAHYYSDTAIMLLMDLEAAADHGIITNLWKMGLSSVADLETDVSELMESTIGQDLCCPSSRKYLYLQYDSVKRWLTGDLPEADSQNFTELVFSCNAQLSHEDFVCHRDIKEMTMWSVDHVIYSHRSGTRETFYQQEIGKSGVPEAARSFPLGHEVLSKVAIRAKAALERDYRISLH